MPVPASKAELRSRILAARRAMPLRARRAADATLIHALVQALVTLVPGSTDRATVAAYVPFGTEPGASASPTLPQALADAGLRVLLPVVLADLDLDWAEYAGPESLAPAGRGLWEPRGPRLGPGAIAAVSAVVAPGVAVDRSGLRLGRGGGSYDRALTRPPAAVPVIVLLYDGELTPRLPAEPHDRRVTAVVTPSHGLTRLP
ncbi:MAG: 5-formyltetrahydrofolate cyclo-ligase [Micromonosporaceae bacterium]|nr:5-formyltetrahydrofolate cyclo-ligase [Micromonosporaceae bacterium]